MGGGAGPLPVSPAHAVAVAQVVALAAVRDVQEDDDAGDEVNELPRGQDVKVGAAIAAPVAVTGSQLRGGLGETGKGTGGNGGNRGGTGVEIEKRWGGNWEGNGGNWERNEED